MKTVNINMMLRVFLLTLSSIGWQLGSSQSAIAENKECSNATLKGTYLVAFIGWQGTGAERKPAAYAGQEIYDGKGTYTGIVSSSVDGSITRNQPFTGIYTVNSDCTGTSKQPGPSGDINLDLFIAPSGDEFVWIETDEGTVFTSLESRVARRVK